MKKRIFIALIAFLTIFAVCGSYYEADAARFGGGRSFGGSSGFTRSIPSSRLPQQGVRNPAATQQQRQQAATPGATAGTRGIGMGGILGGLLAGTLLGSLLAGNGFAGGGMLDILLIGLAIYLVIKFLGRRRVARHAETDISGMRMPFPDPDPNLRRESTVDSAWAHLSGSGQRASTGAAATVGTPAGFDTEEFLRGAKMLYQRMNDSWDRRDLNDIAEFTTRPFMDEIRRQAAESPNTETTEILLVNADLMDVHHEAGRELASVYFNVMMREDPRQTAPSEVREVWHFVRATGSRDMWKLDGIQQVEG